jgi:hypothetical protein
MRDSFCWQLRGKRLLVRVVSASPVSIDAAQFRPKSSGIDVRSIDMALLLPESQSRCTRHLTEETEETEEQSGLLAANGDEEVRGYFFGAPMLVADFAHDAFATESCHRPAICARTNQTR